MNTKIRTLIFCLIIQSKNNEHDATKCRVVSDASLKDKDNEFCLNDYLEEGPNTIPNISDVMINFRSQSVGLTADIQSAFRQIGIDLTDREKLRFYGMTISVVINQS